jgi:hypothetical protein
MPNVEVACVSCRNTFEAALHAGLVRCVPCQEAHALSLPARTLPRHDSPIDAAAALASGIRNRSERAQAAALALSRLQGLVTHADLVAALERSGLDGERAEAEVVRMLAADVLIEPRAGHYRALGA